MTRDFNPFAPFNELPADIRRDIETERGLARPTSRPIDTALALQAQAEQEGISWPAWLPPQLLCSLRDAEQVAVGCIDIGTAQHDPVLSGSGEALRDALLALASALEAQAPGRIGHALIAVHGLTENCRAVVGRTS